MRRHQQAKGREGGSQKQPNTTGLHAPVRDQPPRVADRGPCPKLSSQTVRGLPFGAAALSLVRSQTTTNEAHSPEGGRRKPTSPHPPSVPLSTSPSFLQKHQLNTTPIFAVFRPGKTSLSRARYPLLHSPSLLVGISGPLNYSLLGDQVVRASARFDVTRRRHKPTKATTQPGDAECVATSRQRTS